MWARKEALLKAAGVGLGIEPDRIELAGDSVVAVPPELGTAGDWTIETIPLAGFVAAVAVRGKISKLQLFSESVVYSDNSYDRRLTGTATSR